MKSFKQLREECGCKDKERKEKSKKKTVEVMPKVNDGNKLLMGVKEETLNEKSVSKAQQKFMGMVRAAQKGEGASSPEVAKVASSMKKKGVKDIASTKHKELPEKKKEKQ